MAVFAYLVGDPATGEALVIDPAANIDGILPMLKKTTSKFNTSSTPTAM